MIALAAGDIRKNLRIIRYHGFIYYEIRNLVTYDLCS